MINFWKNTARGKSRYQIRPPETDKNEKKSDECNGLPCNSTIWLHRLEDWPEDPVDEATLKCSRLSKNLEDILKDSSCAGYFVQYLESVSSSTPALFWIDVEKFKSAAVQLPSGVRRSSSFIMKKRKQVIRSISCDVSLLHPSDRACSSSTEISQVCNDSNSLCNSVDSKDENIVIESLKNAILNDAVNIFKRYIALEAVHKLDLTDKIRNAIVSSICHPEGLVDIDCFQVAQERVFNLLKAEHYEHFLQSSYYCKYQIDILTSSKLSLEDVINNEMALFYFMEFLEQERSSILMEFIIAVINFKENIVAVENLDCKVIEKDAIVIYDKYFSMQALCPLGFTSALRLHVEEGICSEKGTSPNCFDRPFRFVVSALRTLLKSFLTSEIYFKYLSELINATHISPTNKKKRTVSECGSDKSFSSQNALLAMGDVNFRRARSPSQVNMVMSSQYLYNPDTLWHRQQEGLSLGRVNSLGRFESKLEPDPDKSSRKGWSAVVGKILPNSDARMDEEMAWQVAHMIVKDVTDLTLAPSDQN